jgi:signal peptidase I
MKKLYILTCSLAAVLAVILVAPLAVRLATGGFYMTVHGTSMMPTYHLGDVLLVDPVGPDDVHVGDIVVARFAGTTDNSALYVHRVLEHKKNSWTLQGDNNKDADPVPITDTQIVGSPVFAMTSGLGQAFTFTQSIYGRIFVGALILLLLFWPSIGRWWGGRAEQVESAHEHLDENSFEEDLSNSRQ